MQLLQWYKQSELQLHVQRYINSYSIIEHEQFNVRMPFQQREHQAMRLLRCSSTV